MQKENGKQLVLTSVVGLVNKRVSCIHISQRMTLINKWAVNVNNKGIVTLSKVVLQPLQKPPVMTHCIVIQKSDFWNFMFMV